MCLRHGGGAATTVLGGGHFKKLKAEFGPLTKLMKQVLGHKVGKVVACGRTITLCGFSGGKASKGTMVFNPTAPIARELKRRTGAGLPSQLVQDVIWLLFDMALLQEGLGTVEPTRAAGRIYRMIELGMGPGGGEDVAPWWRGLRGE